jgi:hypothetical protein
MAMGLSRALGHPRAVASLMGAGAGRRLRAHKLAAKQGGAHGWRPGRIQACRAREATALQLRPGAHAPRAVNADLVPWIRQPHHQHPLLKGRLGSRPAAAFGTHRRRRFAPRGATAVASLPAILLLLLLPAPCRRRPAAAAVPLPAGGLRGGGGGARLRLDLVAVSGDGVVKAHNAVVLGVAAVDGQLRAGWQGGGGAHASGWLLRRTLGGRQAPCVRRCGSRCGCSLPVRSRPP